MAILLRWQKTGFLLRARNWTDGIDLFTKWQVALMSHDVKL